MRICLFTPTFLPVVGGVELVIDTLARGFVERGHESFVLAQVTSRERASVPYPVRHYRRPPKQNFWPELLVFPLLRAYRAWKFDVVLAFYGYPTGYAAGRLKKKLGYGLVVTPRGGDLYLSYHGLKKRRVPAVIRAGYQGADRIVSISQYMTSRLEQFVGDPLPPIDLVPNGIDLVAHDRLAQEASSNPPTLPVQKPFILHLCRVTPIKRVDLAVEAVYQLRSLFERQNLQYVIVGEGKDLDKIRQRVQQYGLQHIVKILGTRVGREKAWLLSNAEAMVATSREEGSPNVILEAMASGLPVLASDISPHREKVERHRFGLLFESENLNSLVGKMEQFLTQPSPAWRTNAKSARDEYDVEKVIDDYLKSCRLAMQGGT